MRYIKTIKDWLQDRVSLIVIVISVGIGIGIGMAIYETVEQPLVNTGAIVTWIGAIVGLAIMFRVYFKERSDEKKTPKLAFGEVYKRDDNTYFIDVGLISGQGRAQRCAGYITVE